MPIVYHTCIVYDGVARLFKSCSEFRVQDKKIKNAIGRTNKFLHWKDIQYFKNNNYHEYDWGYSRIKVMMVLMPLKSHSGEWNKTF